MDCPRTRPSPTHWVRLFPGDRHSDVSLFRDLDSGLLESDARCVGRTSNRHEDVGPLHGSWTVPALKLKADVLSRKPVDTHDLRVQQHVDTFVPKKLQNRLLTSSSS